MKTYPKRICPFCKKEFIPTHHKQLVCKEDHYSPCPDCGKLVKIVDRSYAMFLKNGPRRCKDCTARYSSIKRRSKTNEEKQQILEKRKQTNLQRFGVEFVSQSDVIQQKVIQTNLQRYGVERPNQSEEINNKRKQTNLEKYGEQEASSSESIKAKRKNTLHRKYGEEIDNVSQLPSVRYKVIESVRNKYDVDNVFQSETIKEQIKKTNVERYGVPCPQQSKEIQKTTVDNNLKKYGVEYVSQLDFVKEKAKQTCLYRYGTSNPCQNEEIKDKIRKTNIRNLGVPYPMMNDEIKRKSIHTSMKRYGVPYHVQDLSTVERMIVDPSKSENYHQFRTDPELFISQHFRYKPTVFELTDMLGCTDTPIYDILMKHNCRDIITRSMSSLEHSVLDFLRLNYDGEIVHNDRSVITPYELDIYIPEKRFAIECNPTITHNSSFNDPWGDPPKSYNYHKMKTDLCEEKDIFLFHIFGYEWATKRAILESMIENAIRCISNKIYGRDTYVCEIPYQESKQFLEDNHRQGNMSASIRLGLRLKKTNELVSLMTFNPVRSSIGRKKGFEGVELSRFCSKINYNVVGGASKLFKHFLNKYQHLDVVSFSDRAHTQGRLYETLGFTKVSISEPGYVWVDMTTDHYYTRLACQKQNLRNLFPDDSINIQDQTEKQIMEAHGYARVFDSGTVRWEYYVT